MDGYKKQIWMMILSWIEFEHLHKMRLVCKTFGELLKEEKFWKEFYEKKIGISFIKDPNIKWRDYSINYFLVRWDESKITKSMFEINKNNQRLIKHVGKDGYWRPALTYTLQQGYLYPIYYLDNKASHSNITVGFTRKHLDINSSIRYGCDEYRIG
eukprot:TRINITY_DN14582_c0_g1_i1.p1 TRINITY_DN14582_c0_g1~~TRINITY_DN14582_c0_g1_i1.p1  ORF type:complete len:163 (+),score=25.03 TRINITY_DN14582_c0_g1_i1:23-490(+)